jgi:hypothetical protein
MNSTKIFYLKPILTPGQEILMMPCVYMKHCSKRPCLKSKNSSKEEAKVQ